MKIKTTILLCFIILYNCGNPEKKSKIDDDDINLVRVSMDTHADSLLLDTKINSVSIGIYRNGKKYTAHYGELDKGQKNKPTDSTIYEIASVSKTFTGVLVAQAVLDRKLNLEDDIRKYLKHDFKNLEYNKKLTYSY